MSILEILTLSKFVFGPNVSAGVFYGIQIFLFILIIPLVINAIFAGRALYDLAVERKPFYMEWLNNIMMIYHAWTFPCLMMWPVANNWVWMMLGLYIHAAALIFMVVWIIKKEGSENLKLDRFISPRFLALVKDATARLLA